MVPKMCHVSVEETLILERLDIGSSGPFDELNIHHGAEIDGKVVQRIGSAIDDQDSREDIVIVRSRHSHG